eukprot:scaffold141417_cov23-Cyclotella_meneghiniana.AAC.1
MASSCPSFCRHIRVIYRSYDLRQLEWGTIYARIERTVRRPSAFAIKGNYREKLEARRHKR